MPSRRLRASAFFGWGLLGLAAWAGWPAIPQGSHSPIMVEIPVRVMDRGAFVDRLTIDDFEILDDGRAYAPAALYLVEGRTPLRKQESRTFDPSFARHFYLLFQTTDFDPRMAEAVDHLFASLLLPGDSVTLVTPAKPYSLSRDALGGKSIQSLSREMQQILRKDIQSSGGDYREILRDLTRLVGGISGQPGRADADMETELAMSDFGLEVKLDRYKSALQRLEAIRLMDQAKLLGFAKALKALPGRKDVFFFYQREFRPEIGPTILNQMMSLYQDQPNIIGSLMDLFQFYRREKPFDVDSVKQAFADAAATFHFIFMNKDKSSVMGVHMREHSEDFYSAFTQMAAASGGYAGTATNPAAAFKSAADLTGRYYLLVHTPDSSSRDGRFHSLQIRLKVPGLDVRHRLGYMAQ